MVSATVMSLAHAHGIVREVDIAIIAWEQVVSWRGPLLIRAHEGRGLQKTVICVSECFLLEICSCLGGGLTLGHLGNLCDRSC